MSTPSLDQRIGAALTAVITSADCAALITETETAIAVATKAAAKTRELALDPIASPDANRARASVENANFTVDRLPLSCPACSSVWKKSRQQSAQRDGRLISDRLRPSVMQRFSGLHAIRARSRDR